MSDVQNTEALILEAAIEEFLDKGFDAARTTEIARRAGVNHAMLHYYFRTKENLFNKVFELKSHIVLDAFLQIINTDLPFEEKLTQGIEQHIDFLKANPKLPHFILSALAMKPERVDVLKQIVGSSLFYILNRFSSDLQTEIETGNIRAIEPIDLLVSILSMNLFIFIAQPVVVLLSKANGMTFDQMVERRKQENVYLILARLKK